MKVSAIPNILLSVVGLKVIRPGSTQKRFPVEMSEADKAVFRYVRDNRLSTSSDERLFATIMACRYVVEHKIEGDFVECGVWRGGNSILAAGVFKSMTSEKSAWLFDTFAGMTQPTSFDINYLGEIADGKYRNTLRDDHSDWCYCPIEEVRANFMNAGLLGERVKFVKGDVAETLAQTDKLPGSIAVLRLDTDWYESTKAELDALYPKLSHGGVLIIDDYGHWGGARKAVDEYFSGVARPFLQYIDHTARIGVKLD
jgi:O-methyltransferase